ncbi:hypothetical protein T02_30 [Trichinella nativa]|uniref:Uncharacterized protein n=1 Tax=Trichinella nativa TaxID=6335 RepID=A0A0V1KNQ5_9BILA|nr:hypothetical protein T02_30 [Trichinella nativa]
MFRQNSKLSSLIPFLNIEKKLTLKFMNNCFQRHEGDFNTKGKYTIDKLSTVAAFQLNQYIKLEGKR